ncbi:MAG: alpha/beta fold hydrolase [Acidimicrobiales bacterium]
MEPDPTPDDAWTARNRDQDGLVLRVETIDVGPHRIHATVEQRGAGRPLLLINGIGATGELFRPFRQQIADRETIAFDAPGVGSSSTPILPPTMRQLASVVARMVADLGHEEVDVLGISWGGALAQEMTRRHPRLVRRLVLAATLPGVTAVLGNPTALSLLVSPMRYYSPSYLERVAPALYGGDILDHPDVLAEQSYVRSNRAPSMLGYLYQLMAIATWTSLPWMRRCRQPTLVLTGTDDPIIPVANGRILASGYPNARLEIVEGGGHLFLFTTPERSARLVLDFLDDPTLDDG